MLTLLIFTVLLVLIMINLPIAVAMALTAIAFFVGLDNASLLTMLPAAHVRLDDRVHAARDPVLHPGRQPDEHRRGDRAASSGFAKAVIGHVSGRARPGLRHRQRHLLRHVGFGHRRRGRPGAGAAQGHGRQRVQAQGLRRHRRIGRHHRPRDPSQHPLRAVRRADRRVGRQALPGRLHPGSADGRRHDGRHRAAGESARAAQGPEGRVWSEIWASVRKRPSCR